MTHKHNGKWKPVELGDLIDIFDSIRVPLNSRQRAERQGRFPYYGASGVIDSVDDYLFDGEYVLVAEDGENLNSRKLPVAFMARGQFWVNNHAHIIKGKKGIADDRFLIGWFAQADIKGYITGAAQPKLSQANLKRIALTAPPYPVQRKIAGVLSAYDDLIENNTRRIAILEEMAQAIYREWFVNFRFPGHEKIKLVNSPLGKIPEGWKVERLADACSLTMGQSPSSEFYNENGDGLPFHQGVTNFGERYPTHVTYTTVTNRLAENGDVLFSVRAPVGRLNIADTQLVVGRGVSAIRHKQGKQVFLFHQLREKFKEEDTMGGGTIFKSVTKEDMQKIELICPLPQLVSDFEEAVGGHFSLYHNLTKRNRLLRQARDLLLPKLISGQLDVEELDIDTGEPLVEATT